MGATRTLSSLYDLALLLPVLLLGSSLPSGKGPLRTLDRCTQWHVITAPMYTPVPPFWFSCVSLSHFYRGRRMCLKSRLPYDVDGARSFHLIKLSGDIHPNPGPPKRGIKYPCGECHRNVRSNQDSILCSDCHRWFHVKCIGMRKHIFNYLEQHHLDWECSFC